MTAEAYIQYELTAECRHEYINGQLFEMPGEKDSNNEIASELVALLRQLKTKGFTVYNHDVKVAIPGGEKYYYPDVFATKEAKVDTNRYIKYEPELIAEVLSPSTFRTDTIDKYIAYTTIPSLLYYLIVDPETTYVILHAKTADGEWETTTYKRPGEVIPLPLLELSLPLAEVYK